MWCQCLYRCVFLPLAYPDLWSRGHGRVFADFGPVQSVWGSWLCTPPSTLTSLVRVLLWGSGGLPTMCRVKSVETAEGTLCHPWSLSNLCPASWPQFQTSVKFTDLIHCKNSACLLLSSWMLFCTADFEFFSEGSCLFHVLHSLLCPWFLDTLCLLTELPGLGYWRLGWKLVSPCRNFMSCF